MKLSDETVFAQHTLAEYCRTGKNVIVPGARPERLHHYRRLVRNVINNTLEQAYPITFDLLEKKEWDNLIDDFFTNHNPQTPQVWKLPKEFYHFLRDNNYADKLNKSYLNDLLHFEWIEIEVHTMPDEDIPSYTESGDLLNDKLVFTPEFRIIQLQYPVHVMSVQEASHKKGNYYLLVFRVKESGNVKFLNLSVLLTYLIEQIHLEEKTLNGALSEAQKIFGITNMNEAHVKVQQFMVMLQNQKFLMGFERQ